MRERTSLAKGSRHDECLLLAFYTTFPPLRCDHNQVAYLHCLVSAATIAQNDEDIGKKHRPAMLVLRDSK